MLYTGYYESPIGKIVIKSDDSALYSLYFATDKQEDTGDVISPVIAETIRQLDLYFKKKLQKFDLPLAIKASDFRRKALLEVQQIPHGQLITYLQLAHRMGSDNLTRAVASANASNPILIIIPCHRVVGKNSSMTGYAGEIWRKQWLLSHEGALVHLIS